jgi:hypothetical protein
MTENFLPYRDSNLDSSAVQFAASRYTDFAYIKVKKVKLSL